MFGGLAECFRVQPVEALVLPFVVTFAEEFSGRKNSSEEKNVVVVLDVGLLGHPQSGEASKGESISQTRCSGTDMSGNRVNLGETEVA